MVAKLFCQCKWGDTVSIGPVKNKNFVFIQVGVGDFVLLPKIDMDSFLSNLKARHAAGLIYTYIGEVCVSVNPYKTMDIYGTSYVNQYKVTKRSLW